MQKRALETQTKILAAARDVFSAQGFHGATIDEIALAAQVNKQRIYAYFHNKEGLFAAVLKDCFQAIVTAEKSFFNLLDEDIPHLGEILLRHYLAFHEQHPYFWRLIAWENLDGGKHIAVLEGLRDQAFAHLRELYRKGQKMAIYSQTVSFETFIYVLSAISYFYYSNQHTLVKTLNLNLFDPAIRDWIMEQSLKLIFPKGR